MEYLTVSNTLEFKHIEDCVFQIRYNRYFHISVFFLTSQFIYLLFVRSKNDKIDFYINMCISAAI